MTTKTSTDATSVRVRDTRPPVITPAMSNSVDQHSRVRLSSRWIEIDGRPSIPVTGELHFSRVPNERWEEELQLLAASGLTTVSTYMFWIHHEPERGRISFDGDLDIAAFMEVADRVGMDIILRIGPWCHGEVRNGGHPDWLVANVSGTRTNDPEYLKLAAGWYAAIAEQVAPFCGVDGRIVGIQIENELYEQPEHIRTLKQLAREAGLSAPLWTATGWGGAILPAHEVFPLYSGYADGFWADQGAEWDDSFRDHFTFTHVWDDPGVGGDQREAGIEIVIRDVDPEFPPATCELGGGMATAYHRRPIARGEDIAAVANVKIGNGSLWQGFYMYAGGINPTDHVQESHATGYPCDLPRFDYDFQAAIGSTGQPGASLPLLREHNAFLGSFGEHLAHSFSNLPDAGPVQVHDLDSLRWAVRTDGHSGFIFINTHQPHEPLSAVPQVQLTIQLDDGEIVVPDRPIDIPSGIIARWPLRLDVAGACIEWATASVVGFVEDDSPTLVLRAHHGIAARVLFGPGTTGVTDGTDVRLDEPIELRPGSLTIVDGGLRVLVVDDDVAARLWFIDGGLIEADSPVWSENGAIVARAAAEPRVARWAAGRFRRLELSTPSTVGDFEVGVDLIRGFGEAPSRYGEFMGRSSAPTDAQLDEVAGIWQLTVPPRQSRRPMDRDELVISWEGDVAHLRADGVLIGDKFWDGQDWRFDISHLPDGTDLTLHVAPISSRSVIDLDPAVRARVDDAGTLCAVLKSRLVVSARWTHETA